MASRTNILTLLGVYKDEISKGVKKTAKVVDKSFSSMLAPIVGAAAGYFAFTTALNEAREMEQLALRAADTSKTFDNLTASIGLSAEVLLGDMRVAARGTISDLELMEKANTANLLAGKALVSELPGLIEGARAASAATGQSVDFMFESIVTGIARQSRMILDNLGIIVQTDLANQKYADTLKIQVSALTEAQRKQAFMNAVIEASADLVSRIGGAMELARDKSNRLAAEIENLQIKVGEKLIPVFNELRSAMAFWLRIVDKALDASKEQASSTQEVERLTQVVAVTQGRYNAALKIARDNGQKQSAALSFYSRMLGLNKGALAEATREQNALNASQAAGKTDVDNKALEAALAAEEAKVLQENQNSFFEELQAQFRVGQLSEQERFNMLFLEGDISTAEKRVGVARKLIALQASILTKGAANTLKIEQEKAGKVAALNQKLTQFQMQIAQAAFNNEQALGRKTATAAVQFVADQAQGVVSKLQGIALARALALPFPLNIGAVAAVATGFAAVRALIGAGSGAATRAINPQSAADPATALPTFDSSFGGGGGGDFAFGSSETDTAEAPTGAPTQIALHIQTLDPSSINWEEVVGEQIAPALRKLGELGVVVDVTAG